MSADPFRALRRLHQLANEIQAALACDDIELTAQASELLPSALAEWRRVHATLPVSAGEAAQLALETHQILEECEQSLLRAMHSIQQEMTRLRQGRRAVVRARPTVSPGRYFDAYR